MPDETRTATRAAAPTRAARKALRTVESSFIPSVSHPGVNAP
jgi:hypothetical protein